MWDLGFTWLLSTLFIKRSGIHMAKNKSLALCSSFPVFFFNSKNSNTSECHGSRYTAKAPGLWPDQHKRERWLNFLTSRATMSSSIIEQYLPCYHPGQHSVLCCCRLEAWEPAHLKCHSSEKQKSLSNTNTTKQIKAPLFLLKFNPWDVHFTHPSNIAACCSDTANCQANTSSWFRDEGALLQCVINTIDAVFLHR